MIFRFVSHGKRHLILLKDVTNLSKTILWPIVAEMYKFPWKTGKVAKTPSYELLLKTRTNDKYHCAGQCVKSVRIRSFSGPYFPALD